eukprot:CAMPEP_0113669444 /NCGR_PEP_ID=MMETSP0038_2-20120614/4573_1 /TAXON_ID=2898 /ORGANISM="Cryptomonas paramecium" /LENGTH=37 /DNA_ID=CAMNT_0000585327 /DNA_START=238 /DNA_END=351 /DNA_ORIENTATION=- /assembly_acc=CAM_ASM_000170
MAKRRARQPMPDDEASTSRPMARSSRPFASPTITTLP